jgi:hypothetical protein
LPQPHREDRIKTPRRHVVVAGAVAVGLTLTAPAAAYLCHKDPPGTRILFVHGRIAYYSAGGTQATLAFDGARGCRMVRWNAASGKVAMRAASCSRSHPIRELASSQAQLTPASTARPATLNGWPLPARPVRIAVGGKFAVFAAAGGGGLYALRLSDGHVGLLGPSRPRDTPALTRAGVFYQDDEFKQDRRHGIVRLKFVPTSGIAMIVDRAQRPLITHGRISSLAMDGPRVALAVADPSGKCDRVLYWNVAWRPVQRISAADGPTCVLRRRTAITQVAIGGFRAAWLRASGSGQAIVAGSPKCQEWVIRRLRAGSGADTVTAVAGDAQTLAFAIARHEREIRGTAEVAVISGRFRAVDVAARRGSPERLAIDTGRIAVLWDDGVVEVRGVRGHLLQTLQIGKARALAMSGDRLLALRATRVDAYSLRGRDRVGTWHVPAGLDGLDVHYGVAVLHSPRQVFGLDLETGRHVVLGRTAGGILDAEIEAAGVAYAYNVGARGVVRFVPIAAVMRTLGRGR